MKDKVLLEVLLPATGDVYEFRVPFDLTVEMAARLMARVLASREPARYEASDEVDLMLCAGAGAHEGEELNPNETIRALVNQGVLVDGTPVALA